jgi:phosphoribosyl 1,2-cyclic phosphodiesterase
MMQVRFWGVRGSIPTPGPATTHYGGNTSCIEITSDNGARVIIDAGSGIRKLGQARDCTAGADIFLTHFHWDHIQGIPFFAPLFREQANIRFYSLRSEKELEHVLRAQMTAPHFTMEFDRLASTRSYFRVHDEALKIGDLTVEPFPLNHPQGAQGYRVSNGDRHVVIATDVEHGHPQLDSLLRDWAQDADLLIYDAQYTAAEYERRRGWGHSTPEEAARVATDARVKALSLFHHDPNHDDDTMRWIAAYMRARFEVVSVAQESSCVNV